MRITLPATASGILGVLTIVSIRTEARQCQCSETANYLGDKDMFKKKYPALSFAENFLGGHLDLGPITIYGENAMHWAVTIRIEGKGYLSFRLPLRCFGQWWPLYCFFSPDGTPSGATNNGRWFWGKKACGY